MKLILASASPRRRELLVAIGLVFDVIPSAVEEIRNPGEAVAGYVSRLAREKAREVARRHPQAWVIGADTVVFIDGEILEKPRDEAEASHMLSRLSGREHTVYSGLTLCCIDQDREETVIEETRVRMSTLDPGRIDWYVSTGEPMDKAGAYAVQGIGAMFIESIDGNYTNVVGLPLSTLLTMMERAGMHPDGAFPS